MSGFNIDDYVTVAERVASFYERYPEGSIQAELIELNETRVVMRAYAYRKPDDERPGIAHSMLGIPGSTPYTRGSELENAETSAVGRAIAMLGFHVKKSLASGDEIRSKGGDTVRADVERHDDGSLVGTVQVGDRQSSDFLLRQTPEGSALGFRLRGDKGGILVRAIGPLADQLLAHKDAVVGARVTVWGRVNTETFMPKASAKNPKPREVSYQVLTASKVSVPDVGELPQAVEPKADISEAESEAIWNAVAAGE